MYKEAIITQAVMPLWQWLAVKDAPTKSDIIFLFGSPSLEAPEKGLELFNAGIAPVVVATGKLSVSEGNPFGDKTLGQAFKSYLVEHGVPEQAIILEDWSTNTQEDVQFTMPILQEKGIKHESALLVTRSFHQRRAYATFAKTYPQVTTINVPADEVTEARLHGDDLPYIVNQCLEEYEKLQRYGEQGYLVKQDVPLDVSLAYEQLKQTVRHG